LATTWTHAVTSKEAYAPFGEAYNEAGTPDRSFTGQDQDVASASGSLGSGTYDFLFRKYDPAAGRWLSPDPAGWAVVSQADPQSLNRYAYVENQPTNAVDPDGLDVTSIGNGCYESTLSWGVSASDDQGNYASGGGTDITFYCTGGGGTGQGGTNTPATPPKLRPRVLRV